MLIASFLIIASVRCLGKRTGSAHRSAPRSKYKIQISSEFRREIAFDAKEHSKWNKGGLVNEI
jgi:hypothetical protein